MPDRCPQDGGFIGSCGCTHPNHEHSELVKAVLEDSHDPYPLVHDAPGLLGRPDVRRADVAQGLVGNPSHALKSSTASP